MSILRSYLNSKGYYRYCVLIIGLISCCWTTVSASQQSLTKMFDIVEVNNIIMYKNFDNETLTLFDKNATNQRLQCEYYKYNTIFYCTNGHSSSYQERENCKIVNKQRWCMCMGRHNDCFRSSSFYW